MKLKKGTWALSILLAVMLVSVVMVPVVSADEPTRLSGDVVDESTLIERSPSLIQEYRSNPDTEEPIAGAIHNSPRVTYLAGW